ncbi:MAG: histidine phosphatase family protein [Deltaproteobacteria bacterium]|uniref:Histidine phosphatase family protein n=1 Tax=Candidatus Zymogenus saltonus TaxID=2844893 RepID=A0A9D8KCI3_9DELT|nr:histidine phosphatase family protein [Candidatus Zymogenus saltonus]
MRIILVTHAETDDAPPRFLSKKGVKGAKSAAGRIRRLMGDDFRVTKAVSSPAVRCIETALVILKELSGERLRRLDTDPRLMAAKEPMEPDQLLRAIKDYACDGILITLHSDLANALPKRERIEGVIDGWFQTRPVLAIIDWEEDRPWDGNRVLTLLGPDGKPLTEPDIDDKEKPLLLT